MGIMAKNVSFLYGDKQVLDNVNLLVNTGESIGIIGESGSGKTTLFKLLAGLYQPCSGKIAVNNATVMQEIRSHVAVVMQNSILFPATIKENITCGHYMDEATIENACDAAQLSDWIYTLPDGIDTFVGERNGKVSGGQAQRIAIARAIAKNASVILLDEATSALDSDTSNAVITALTNLAKEKTVVHISHRSETLVNCNRIFRLDGGKLYVT